MHHHIRSLSIALVAGFALSAAPAGASVVLPLGPLHTGAFIQNYFNGGSDSVANDGTGPNLGITFSANAEAISEAGSGKFENNPSGQTEVLYFASSNTTTAYMNYAAGFNSLSFNYSYSNNTGAAEYAYLYSGLNGTGTLLDTIVLGPATSGVTACASRLDAYCTWQGAASGTISGTAESVVFSGLAGGVGSASSTGTPTTLTEFDGVTLTPVPLPAAGWLLVSGAASLFGLARRRKLAA